VIVIGGGLAGLAAGVALAEAGWRVRLFEQRPFLGGRATSYVLPDGEHVDNCQHVTLGCCTNLDDFYRRVGSTNKVKFFDRLLFLDPQGRRGEMQAGVLPAPFHMTGSFARFAPLTLADKFSIARAMLTILRTSGHPSGPAGLNTPAGISMLQWLKSQHQTQRAIDRFWRVVLVSALDEELDKTDARFGIDVFWKAFLSNNRGYRMGVPIVPLAELYDGCRAFIEKQGGEVQLRAPVRALNIENNSVASVAFDNNRVESADAYVFAVPHDTFAELLPPEIAARDAAFCNLDKIKDAPITGVHFWFDREVTSEPFITLLDTTVQWVFNKTALYGPTEASSNGDASPNVGNAAPSTPKNSPARQYLQLVISASYDLLQKPRQEIIDLCLKEIRQALPAAREANLVKATVIKEAAATFSPQPGVDRWRPKQETSVNRLFLAGDWTATGWPATMEGAVRSGYLAAEAVTRVDGALKNFLQPDLGANGLVSLWAGKKTRSRR
jgi:squalene-associated FAD-dependent desaturase